MLIVTRKERLMVFFIDVEVCIWMRALKTLNVNGWMRRLFMVLQLKRLHVQLEGLLLGCNDTITVPACSLVDSVCPQTGVWLLLLVTL